MDIELAIKARLPIITAHTSDIINAKPVLNYYANQEFETIVKSDPRICNDKYYYKVAEEGESFSPDFYEQLEQKNSCFVIINPEEPIPFAYHAGELPVPRDLVYDTLQELSLSERQSKALMPYLGGITLQDVTEIIRLTQARSKSTEVEEVGKTRQMYVKSFSGLDLVLTDISGYTPDPKLQLIAQFEKHFFLKSDDYRLRPRGIMAHGEPGTGKTMGAKYLSKEWGVPLYRLDATIQSKWAGESEENLAKALRRIEAEQPCILLIDEVEKLFTTSSDSGVTTKLLGGLLWWMQEHRSKVLVYMTCNDLEKVPPELYRSGRIDEVIEFERITDMPRIYDIARNIYESYQLPEHIKENPRWQDYCEESMTPADINEMVIDYIKHKLKETNYE